MNTKKTILNEEWTNNGSTLNITIQKDVKWDEFKSKIYEYDDKELEIIRKSFNYSVSLHKGQKRKFSHDPYIIHPIRVAINLYGEKYELIAAALLHDIVEDTEIKLSEINDEFGYKIMMFVKGMTKSNKISICDALNSVLDKFPEVILLKLSDRIDNMEDKFNYLPETSRRRYYNENKLILKIAKKLIDGNKIKDTNKLYDKLRLLHHFNLNYESLSNKK